MQNLIVGDLYKGFLTKGPCQGTTCLLTFLGRDLLDSLNKFQVLEEVYFGEDPMDPEFDGWWHVNQVVMLGSDWWEFTPIISIEENE